MDSDELLKPCTDERADTTVDASSTLKAISALGAIQLAPAVFEGSLGKSTLLTAEQQEMLLGWLKSTGTQVAKSTSNWKLIWRGSKDGFRSHDFHSLCDLKGATVTVIRSSNGYVFGGYTPAAWDIANKRGSYSNAPGSFLFTLSNPHAIPPTKYPVKVPEKAIQHHTNFCQFFGDDDLVVVSDCNANCNSHSYFPVSYGDTTGKGNLTFTGNDSFQVADIEVFTR
jgi:hypothetical protein